MPRIAAECAAQHLQRLACAVGRAAAAMGQRDDAVDVGVAGQRFGMDVAAEVVGDRACDGRRAVHRGQHADVIARGDAAVGAHDAVEGRGCVDIVGRMQPLANRVVERDMAELEVVAVHMLARRDVLLGAADNLVVATYRCTGGNRVHSHLVAGRNEPAHRHALARQHGARQQLPARDDDIVGRMNANDRRVIHRSTPRSTRARVAAARRGRRSPSASRRRASGTAAASGRVRRRAACRC